MIHAINDVLGKTGLEQAKPATLSVERTETVHQANVQSLISEFGGIGWVCLTDRIVMLPKEIGEITGKIVLSGELSNGNKSLHIRQNGPGWELFDMASSNSGEQLMVEEKFISTKDKDVLLTYETYWKKDSTGTLAPFASRFAGFSGKGGKD